jgi:NCS1 family nucleobase:cation symporter-1
MVGFFLAFVFTLPLMFIHTANIRHLFTIKSVVFPLAALGVVCWATTANGGVSADKLVDPSQRPATSVFAWGLVSQFNAVMGANSALLVTVPDLARYSKTPNAQLYGQLLGLPLAGTVCSAFGIITTVGLTERLLRNGTQLMVLRLQSKTYMARYFGILTIC